MNQNKNKTIAFFGDSLTEGIPGVSCIDILQQMLPDQKIVNSGKSGDTVKSLNRRIQKQKKDQVYDIIFLWIGTNDVFVDVSRSYPLLKFFFRQFWAKNAQEFRHYYRKILDKISTMAERVIAVSPLFIGEDPDNIWNEKLGKYSDIIQGVSNEKDNVIYLDLLKDISLDKQSSHYIANNIFRLVFDAVFLRTQKQIDNKSADRGLIYTLDGVHLNSKGAQKVADVLYKQITSQ
jgi:lysophospholipase L1-like esterase